MDAREAPQLILELEGTTIQFPTRGREDDPAALWLGKDAQNDLTYTSAHTSRHHARLEIRNNDFYLVDASTNGTYVQTEDEQVTYVHRDQLRLWGAGWISLGEPLHVAQPIYFRRA